MSEVLDPVEMAVIEAGGDKPTLDDMDAFVLDEVCRGRTMQRSLVETGHLLAPDRKAIRRIVVGEALMALLDMFRRHEVEARRLFSQLERNRRRAS